MTHVYGKLYEIFIFVMRLSAIASAGTMEAVMDFRYSQEVTALQEK